MFTKVQSSCLIYFARKKTNLLRLFVRIRVESYFPLICPSIRFDQECGICCDFFWKIVYIDQIEQWNKDLWFLVVRLIQYKTKKIVGHSTPFSVFLVSRNQRKYLKCYLIYHCALTWKLCPCTIPYQKLWTCLRTHFEFHERHHKICRFDP